MVPPKYHDVMTIAIPMRKKPDFFITSTMNPNCLEVTRELKPEQIPYDQLDLCCKIINMKQNEIVQEIAKKNILEGALLNCM